MPAHTPDLIVIGNYPPIGQVHSNQSVGSASCTKNTILSLQKIKPKNILVLADIQTDQPKENYEEKIQIKRIWYRNDPLLGLSLINQLKQYPKNTPILFAFEVAMLGQPLVNIWVPIILIYCYFKKQPVTIVLHQVINDFSELSQHIGQSKNSPLVKLTTKLLQIFYMLIGKYATNIVVFEQFLKKRLIKLNVANTKINVIPHGSETKKLKPKTKGKLEKKLPIKITEFGYLAWYKGSHWIAQTLSNQKNFHLTLAGGPNPNHATQKYAKDYLNQIQNIIRSSNNIILTGYVPQDEISKIYQKSDLIIFPYLAGMSSSGPLSLAFSYHKPVLISEKLSPLLRTRDIQDIAKSLNLDLSKIIFPLNPKLCQKKINVLMGDTNSLDKLRKFGKLITEARSWENIGQQYFQLLFP